MYTTLTQCTASLIEVQNLCVIQTNSRKVIATSWNAPKWHYGGGGQVWKIVILCQCKSCDTSFVRSMTITILVKWVFNCCHTYAKGRLLQNERNIGILKVIVLHPYPRSEEYQHVFKATHNIRYRNYEVWIRFCSGSIVIVNS